MKQNAHPYQSSVKRLEILIRTATVALALLVSVTSETSAQTLTNITSSGLNTVVTAPAPGGTVYSITNGKPAGANLFHSFGEFSIGALDTARFQTGLVNPVADATVLNILGRVTGGNPSNLFGTIDSATYYPSANLFLMNPAGIVFGPNATLNVGGSVNFTTADYLRLADDVRFNAIPDAAADALLSAERWAAFGFLDLAPGTTRGAISVQDSTLSVPDGQSITLVGGDVIITNGNVSAPNGQIRLASANSIGEFQHDPLQAIANADGQVFSTYGVVTLASGSTVDLTHAVTGTVSIRGGEFVLNVTNSILTTSTAAPIAPAENSISLTGGSLMRSTTTNGADGAAINIITDTLEVKGASQIVSSNEGPAGIGGDTNITATKSVVVSGYDEAAASGVRTDFGIVTSGVFAGTTSDGTGGALTITTPKLTIEDSAEVATLTAGAGSGQTMTLDVGDLEVKTGGRVSTISGWNYLLGDFGDGPGLAGMINIVGANSISVAGTGPFNNYSRIQGTANGFAGGGSAPIEINAPSATVTLENGGRIETMPGFSADPTGDITLTIKSLNGTNGSLNTVGGDARSGNIRITAADTISLSGEVIGQPFSINNESGGSGGTGIISIETRTLTLANRARILNSTFSDPTPSADTKISINATELVSMTGGSDIRVFSFLSEVGGLAVFSPTVALSGQSSMNTFGQGAGNSGPITINTQNFSLIGGSKLNSSVLSGSSGIGGSITIQGLASPAESVRIDGVGSGVISNTRGTGPGGNITIDTNTLAIQNSGTISASTSGAAPSATGGNITLAAGTLSLAGNAILDSSTTGAGNAGTIQITTTGNTATIASGSVIKSSTTSTGNAGQIVVTTPSLTLDNGTMTTSTSGAGQAGGITVNAGSAAVQGGGQLSSSSSTGTGAGGTLLMQGLTGAGSQAASLTITGAGSGLFSTTSGSGAGGSITANANQMTISNGGTISAASTGVGSGSGNAGSIQINSKSSPGQQLVMQNGSITTQTEQAGGGGISIYMTDMVRMTNSKITTSVKGGDSNAGNITIDPNSVILQNSQILAQAIQGAGGNITITTPLFLADQTSFVSASSQFGLNGTVNIQSPTSNLSGTVASLPSSMRQSQGLQTGRCAALANSQSSSLIIAGRETIPTEPGGWLPSPFALLALTEGEDSPFAAGAMRQPAPLLALADETVSLRRLTPAGFLTQSFAESGSTGCRS